MAQGREQGPYNIHGPHVVGPPAGDWEELVGRGVEDGIKLLTIVISFGESGTALSPCWREEPLSSYLVM